MSVTAPPAGGSFLVQDTAPAVVFTPEDFDNEARMIAQTADDFLRKEVFPVVRRLDAHEPGLLESLFGKMAELGLLGVEVPVEFGGLWLPKTTVALLIERLGAEPSICLTHQAHAGLATLPLLFTGTPVQKEKYLPKLASGEIGASYCLSEPNSGSDALGAQTRATLSADGKTWTLNGSKMWVTNASFASLFTVFAKIDGEKFTAFLVERGTPGVEPAREEDKIGLRGSSTRRLQLENVVIPVENQLGEEGRGHVAAFNTLNMGRFKMAASALGAAKHALATTAAYANQREQFKRPISSFGLMQHKLGEMCVRLFALESMIYRTAGYIDGAFHGIEHTAADAGAEYVKAASEFAVECSIIKVFGTETQFFCVDEGLQIHGGYGYTEDFPIARQFRDGRIPRVYEGTNEINRMVISQALLRKAERAELTVAATQPPRELGDNPIESIATCAHNLKNASLIALVAIRDGFVEELREQQESLAVAADLVSFAYGLDSVALRLKKLRIANNPRLGDAIRCGQVYAQSAVEQSRSLTHTLSCALASTRASMSAAAGYLRVPSWDVIGLRRAIANGVIEAERYFI